MTSNRSSFCRSNLNLVALTVAFFMLGACASNVQKRVGFIPESIKLKEVDKETSSFRSPSLVAASFTEIMVESTTTPAYGAYGDLSEEQLGELRIKVTNKLKESFATMPGVGNRAAPRRLVIHAAITAIKPNKPVLNVAPQTQMLKRGYGFASCEIYATEGESGPIVAAFMQTVDTQRFDISKLTPTGTAALAADEWAKEFRKLFGN